MPKQSDLFRNHWSLVSSQSDDSAEGAAAAPMMIVSAVVVVEVAMVSVTVLTFLQTSYLLLNFKQLTDYAFLKSDKFARLL